MATQRTWLQWLFPRPFDYLSTILYAGAWGVHFYFCAIQLCRTCACTTTDGSVAITVAILLLPVMDRLEFWWYGEKPAQPVAIGFYLMRFLLTVLISILDRFNFSMFLYVLAPFTAYFVFGRWGSYMVALVAWLVYFFKIYMLDTVSFYNSHEVIFFLVYSFGLIFMVIMAQVVSREQASRQQAERLLSELAASHQQLRDYASRVAELATTEERNRLARDIHDSLGHFLTVINIQLEKALAFRERKPTEAEQSVQEAKRLASEALRDIRRSVGTLREGQEHFSLTRALGELVQNAANDQMQIDLQIEGEERGFAQQSLIVLYRAAQEGLTNVQKHARADHASVTVKLAEQAGVLQICDNGRGLEPTVWAALQNGQSSGFGLRGVQERLELLGGSLRLANTPGQGLQLLVTVPRIPLALVGMSKTVGQ